MDEVYYDLPFYAGVQVLRFFPDSEFSTEKRKKRSGSVAAETEILSANDTIEAKFIDGHVASNLSSLTELGMEASDSTGLNIECKKAKYFIFSPLSCHLSG